MAVIRVRDQKIKRWCYLAGETLAHSAKNERANRESLIASIDSLCSNSPSAQRSKKLFKLEAITVYDKIMASHDDIKNKNKESKEDK